MIIVTFHDEHFGDYKITQQVFICTDCNKKYLFEGDRWPGFSDHCTVNCPQCEKELGKMRSDVMLPVLVGEYSLTDPGEDE